MYSESSLMSFKVNLLHVLLLISTANAQTPEFIVHPASINTTDGTTVEFTCTASNNPLTMFFLINETDVSVDDEEKGFMEFTIQDNGGLRERTLIAMASAANNNNTQIKCQAIGNAMIVNSNIATLIVQGPLSSVIDLTYSFIDSSSVNISWSPPFTLPGTNITGYNISATSNGTTTNYFTSDSYYVLLLTDITDSPCNEIITTVSGYNGLDGENESLTEIYLPSATVGSPVPMSFTINSQLDLSVMFDISNLCVSQYPKNAIFFLFANGVLTTDNPSFVLSWDTFTAIDILILSEDITYTLVASLSNLAGTFDHNSTVTFNTFSIESVAITDTTDGRVCVECVFASFSTDSGCTIELVSNNNAVQYTDSFSRSSDSTVASGCISDVIAGVYSVRMFNGRGKAMDISLHPSDITVTNVAIIVTTTTSATATTTITVTETSDISFPSPSNPPTIDLENSGRNAISGGSVVQIVITGILVLIGVLST